ncbi:MAG: hypothetical protein Fur002_14120 [Anaerolineales bacterium]
MSLRVKIPSQMQIIQVYAVIVLMIYGWTLYRYAWKVPSWTYYLTLGEMAHIYAYALVVNFLESAALLAAFLSAALILPAAWLGELFAARSVSFLLPALTYAMLFSNSFKSAAEKDYPQNLAAWLPALFAFAALLAFAAGRWSPLRRAAEEFSARAVIFLYIFMPISALAAAYLFLQNLWMALR